MCWCCSWNWCWNESKKELKQSKGKIRMSFERDLKRSYEFWCKSRREEDWLQVHHPIGTLWSCRYFSRFQQAQHRSGICRRWVEEERFSRWFPRPGGRKTVFVHPEWCLCESWRCQEPKEWYWRTTWRWWFVCRVLLAAEPWWHKFYGKPHL